MCTEMIRKIRIAVHCAFIPVVCAERNAQNESKAVQDSDVFDRLKTALLPT